MWRRRLYHRCEQLFKEKISGRRKRRGRKKRRKWIRGIGQKRVREIPRIFDPSLFPSFPLPLPLSQLSTESSSHPMGNRSKQVLQRFRRRTVSNDNAIDRDTRYSNENTVH